MGKPHFKAVGFVAVAVLIAVSLVSCTPKLTDIYYADGNMLIFSGDTGRLSNRV